MNIKLYLKKTILFPLKTGRKLGYFLLLTFYVLKSKIIKPQKNNFTFILRSYAIDADAEETIRQVINDSRFDKLYIITNSTCKTNDLLKRFEFNNNITGVLGKKDILEITRVLINSKLVITSDSGKNYLIAARLTGTKVVKIPHGVTFKTTGRFKKKKKYLFSLNYFSWDKYSVSSELHLIRQAASIPYIFDKLCVLGLPRFDKFNLIIEKNKNVDLRLENNFKVLFAPTHSSSSKHLIKKFISTNLNDLLSNNNGKILIRTHIVDRLTNTDINVAELAGSDIYPSLSELFTQIDVLVTDISSIYVDSLPFDIPIIFIDALRDRRTIDNEFIFPGPVVNTEQELCHEINQLIKGVDKYECNRNVNSKLMLAKGKNKLFIERCCNELAL